jgi:hypothetical protein
MPRLLSRRSVRYVAVAVFVLLASALGALIATFVVWVFTVGLLPPILDWPIGLAGAGVGGYWGYVHTDDVGWTALED